MTTSIAATAFVRTEGVNVGELYTWALQDQVNDLLYLGISNVRSGPLTPGENAIDSIAQVTSLAAAGIRLDIVDEPFDSDGSLDPQSQLLTLNSIQAAAPGVIRYVEGLNEINNEPISYGGYTNASAADELAAANAYQQAIYNEVTSDTTLVGVGVVGFTGFDSYDNANSQQIGGGDQVAEGEATVDNQHVYPPFNLPPGTTQYSSTPYDNPNSQEVSPFLAHGTTLGAPIIYTEAGYSSASQGGSEQLQAIGDVDLLLDDAKNGVAATYLYSINDGGPPGSSADDGYGLFYAADNTANPDGPKPVATAIHNLNAILSANNTGAVSVPAPIPYGVAGGSGASNDLEITQTDGNSVIALWNQGTAALGATGTLAETVTLGGGSQSYDVSIIDPMAGTAAVASYSDVNSVAVALSADPLLVEVSPVTASPTIGSGSGTIGVVISVGDETTTFNIVGWDPNNEPGTFTWATETQAADTTVTYLISAPFASTTALTAVTNIGAGETVTIADAIYQGETAAYDQVVTNPSGYSVYVPGRIVQAPTVTIGTGPATISVAVSTGDNTSEFNLVGWDPANQPNTFTWQTVTQAADTTVTYNIDAAFRSSSALVAVTNVLPGDTVTVSTAIYQGVTTAIGQTFTTAAGGNFTVPGAPTAAALSGTAPAPSPPPSPSPAASSGSASSSGSAPASGAPAPFAAASASGIGAAPLATYNWNPGSQLANFLANPAGASIAFVGDSTTLGFGGTPSNQGYVGTAALPAEVTAYLNQDGIAAQDDNSEGQGNELGTTPDARVSLVGQAAYSFPLLAGGEDIAATHQGDGVTFTPLTPVAYTKATISYLSLGNGTLDISINGGPVISKIALGNSNSIAAQTVTLPVGTPISSITAVTDDANPAYIQGISLSGGPAAAAQIYDLGVGGAESSIVGSGSTATGVYTVTPISAGAVLSPTLVFINFGINDMLQGNLTAAQTTANLGLMVQEYKSVGSEPVIVVPQAISSATYTSEIATLQQDIYTLATQEGVPVIDLSATYGTSWQALSNAGLMSDYAHPNATFYSDFGKGIAGLLAAAAHK